MWDVFISYKAEDRPRVEPLVDALEGEGLSVWWDARVTGGEAWREAIAEHLEAARCVIVVWSKRSTSPEGRFVRDEASRAQQRGTYLPITIDKVQPPLGFGEMQALSLTGWKGGASDPHYRAVSACVHSMLGRTAPAENAHEKHPRFNRRAALAAGGAAVVAAAGAGGWLLLRSSGARANTIAVLPFANLSGDPSQSYFSDGIAEEVRSALAGLGGVEVVARTSSEMLRNADAVTAARRLSVANVVTGSVRRSPSTVRVSAQLVDGRNGLERWSQTFDRPLGDVLQIQTDIAANVARALSIQLSGPAADALSIGGTSNPQAQDVLLQALDLEGGDDSSEGMLRRIALFERATQLDPNYAQAHARKGLTQTLWANAWAPSNADKYSTDAEALRSIRRAIAIAPAMPLGYSALGLVYFNQLMLKPSLEALSRSVQLAGADSLAFLNYSVILCRLRRQAEAEAAAERAISVDPLNATAWQIKTWTLFLGRRYPQSIDAARQTLSIAPENRRARTLLAWDLLFLGRTDEAVSELQHVPADDYRRFVAEGAMAARSNRREDALRAIQGLEKRYGDTVHYQLAEIYAQLGDGDKAVANLEAAWLVRDSGLATLQVDPFLDPVRNDPRFSKIAARLFG
jgi:serine/threonine-protein kinase